jgi:hypothetical protein
VETVSKEQKKSSKLGRDGKGVRRRRKASGNVPSVDAASDLAAWLPLINGLRFNGVAVVPLILLRVFRVNVLAMLLVFFRERAAYRKNGGLSMWETDEVETD